MNWLGLGKLPVRDPLVPQLVEVGGGKPWGSSPARSNQGSHDWVLAHPAVLGDRRLARLMKQRRTRNMMGLKCTDPQLMRVCKQYRCAGLHEARSITNSAPFVLERRDVRVASAELPARSAGSEFVTWALHPAQSSDPGCRAIGAPAEGVQGSGGVGRPSTSTFTSTLRPKGWQRRPRRARSLRVGGTSSSALHCSSGGSAHSSVICLVCPCGIFSILSVVAPRALPRRPSAPIRRVNPRPSLDSPLRPLEPLSSGKAQATASNCAPGGVAGAPICSFIPLSSLDARADPAWIKTLAGSRWPIPGLVVPRGRRRRRSREASWLTQQPPPAAPRGAASQ
jgi:hypothetical protein